MNFNLTIAPEWIWEMINEQDVKFLDFNQFLKFAQISFAIHQWKYWDGRN